MRTRFGTRVSHLAVALAVLLTFSGAAPAQHGSDTSTGAALRPMDRAAIHTIAEFTASAPGDATDRLLSSAGFDAHHTAEIPRWREFSPVRKIETAYGAARDVSRQNGEQFKALLARDLALQYDTVRYDPVLKPYVQSARSNMTVTYTSARRAADAPMVTDPATREAIVALSAYADATGPLSAEKLLYHAQVPTEHYYEILRDRPSATTVEVMDAALGRVSAAERDSYLERMVRHVDAHYYPTAREERSLRRFFQNEPSPLFMASTEPHPLRGPGANPATPPRRSPASASPGSWFEPGPGGGGFSGAAPRPRPGPIGSGGGGGAGARFRILMSERIRTGAGVSFDAMTRGSMSMRLGGVQFGNSVHSVGTEAPVAVQIDDALRVVGRGGNVYVLEGADPGEACAAVRMAQSEAQHGYGLAGLTDNLSGRYNVLLNPALVNTALGRDAVLVDALPINMQNLLPSLPGASPRDRAQVQVLLDLMYSNPSYAGTWQVVDVEMDLELRDGLIVVRPHPEPNSGALRGVFVEMRPVTRKDDSSEGFDSAWADRFRALLPTLARIFPPYATVNRFARTLAVVRWAKQRGATLPSKCKGPPKVATPDAVHVKDTKIAYIRPFDVATELCRQLGEKMAESGAKAEEARSVMSACPVLLHCVMDTHDRRSGSGRSAAIRQRSDPGKCLAVEAKRSCQGASNGDACEQGLLSKARILMLAIWRAVRTESRTADRGELE